MNSEISLIETGRSYIVQKDYKVAEEIFKKIIQLNPDNEEAHFELGKIYYIQEKYPQAIERLKKAIMLTQNEAHVYLLLAKSYKSAKRYHESIPEFKKALELGYRDENIYKELFEVYRILDKFDLSPSEVTAAIKSGYSEELYRLIQKYNFSGRYELTRELAPGLLKSIPQDNIFLRNKVLNELEIAQGKTILSSYPRRLTVTLSNRCNLFCIMCLTRYVKWEIPRRTIEELYTLFPYLEKVMWQGGEVFALDFFEEILTAGFQYPHLRQSIVTNGQLITEDMAEKLVKNNVELTISIDGVSKEVYEHIRKGANFEILIRNLKLISELKKKHKSNIVLNLNVAVMKSNYHQLEGFIDFAKEYGFEFICLMPIHIHLKTPEDIFTNQDIEALSYITKISPKIEEKVKKYGIRLENRLPRLNEAAADKISDEPKDDIRQLLCHIPWQQLLIDYDGSVRPDCLCRIDKSAGSLLDNLSLGDIWNNKVMAEYRKRIFNHDYRDFCNPICFSGKISESHLKIP